MKKIQRFLQYRPRSSLEVRKKLTIVGYDTSIINDVVIHLKSKNIIDDERLMKIYADELLRKNYGYRRILLELSNKGISEELIDKLKETYPYETEIERAKNACNDKTRKTGKANLNSERRKLKEYLIRRGFNGGTAEEAIRSLK